MLRVIFDTNVYGHLAVESDSFQLEKKLLESRLFLIYGYRPIRKELRNLPLQTIKSKRFRMLLLNLYDRITKQQSLDDVPAIRNLANLYFEHYKGLGGCYPQVMRLDFLIVACASHYALDIVCSNDRRTLMSSKALQSYYAVNTLIGKRTPRFLKYEELLTIFRDLF